MAVQAYPFDEASDQRSDIARVGNTAWVSNVSGQNGANSVYHGSRDHPFASLDYAFSQMTANNGDTIIIMPNHAETTTLIGADVAGVKVKGTGYGRSRPTFTATTAASDLLSVSAANIEMENIRLVGAASGVTALMDLVGTDFIGTKISFEHGATPLAAVTVGAAHRFQLIDCTWLGTANGPDYCVSIETKCHDWQIIRPRALYGQAGLDLAFLRSVAACLGYVIEDPILIGMDTLIVSLASSSAGAPDGLWVGGSAMYSAAVASVEDGVAAATSLGLAFARPLYVTDATGKTGGRIPLTSAS